MKAPSDLMPGLRLPFLWEEELADKIKAWTIMLFFKCDQAAHGGGESPTERSTGGGESQSIGTLKRRVTERGLS